MAELEQLDEPEPDPNLVKMADEAMAMGVDTAWNSSEEFPLSFNTESAQPSAEYQEALLVLDGVTYLHIQPCDTGWDYTLYDKETMKELDGGPAGCPGTVPFRCCPADLQGDGTGKPVYSGCPAVHD